MSAAISTRLATLASLAVLAAACGDLYSDPPVGPTELAPSIEQAPNGPSVAFDASAGAARDIAPSCPDIRGVEGALCNSLGSTCEYGSSPDQRCNTTLSCTPQSNSGETWVARPSLLCPSYECPRGPSAPIAGTPCALPAEDGGTPSDADELVCPMSDGICACTTGTDPAHAHARVWVCVKPATACPLTRPLVGAVCDQLRTCDYGSCAFKQGMKMECNGIAWASASASCN